MIREEILTRLDICMTGRGGGGGGGGGGGATICVGGTTATCGGWAAVVLLEFPVDANENILQPIYSSTYKKHSITNSFPHFAIYLTSCKIYEFNDLLQKNDNKRNG